MSSHHLAQVNIATMRAPLSDPIMAEFVARLDQINQAADRSPGFVWRLQTDAGNATEVQAYDDERILFNLSVWESLEALFAYVYRSQHGDAMRQRRDWFEPSDQATMALWWLPAGELPTVTEAKARLEHLRQFGSTSQAFLFHQPFPVPAASVSLES
jgi:heme-degrading monooxygenase HmoA